MHGIYFNTYNPPQPLWCTAQTKFPGVNQMIPNPILSDNAPICGQTQRSSVDFQVGGTSTGTNKWVVKVGAGISFDILQDINMGKDVATIGTNLTNGSPITLNPSNSYGTFDYYIANPKGATQAFNVSLTPDTSQTIPPPPPQPPH